MLMIRLMIKQKFKRDSFDLAYNYFINSLYQFRNQIMAQRSKSKFQKRLVANEPQFNANTDKILVNSGALDRKTV